MKDFTLNGRPFSREAPPVVSRTAILILSSVLIGTAMGRGSLSGLNFYCFCAGIVGLISFLGLDYLAARRSRNVVRREMDEMTARLSARIERHVPAVEFGPIEKPRCRARRESSYVTVNVG